MRPSRPIVTMIATAGLALAAGCSEKPSSEEAASQGTTAVDVSEAPPPAAKAQAEQAADAGAPGLSPSAAPGVAFSYQYSFSLPGKAISEVQQQHAAACEELGPDKCQVTGMDYRQDDGGDVTAHLDLMVAPGIAHRFGKDAVDIVKQAEGELANANVTGENAGGEIEDSQLRSSGLQNELTRIEKRLATPGLSTDERRMLAQRADELRNQLRIEETGRAANEKRLATTPMRFDYASKGLFAASDNPFGHAAESSWGSMKTMLAVLMTLLGVALPWLLLAALVALAWRGLRRRAAPANGMSEDASPQ